VKTFDAGTVQRWRDWLKQHHDSEAEVWLIFHKKHTGKPSVAYKDALDEALCYGWIDSLIKRIDDDRYARKFTPRKPGSNWSSINVKRYNELRAARKLAPPGLARSPDGQPVVDGSRSTNFPSDIEKAIKKNALAWRFFESLAPSYKRLYVRWIDGAKREETRRRRVEQLIEKLRAGRKPGLA
jgi:uncharacterized protein YdeI (YjbR/CyaY-like superfamily)